MLQRDVLRAVVREKVTHRPRCGRIRERDCRREHIAAVASFLLSLPVEQGECQSPLWVALQLQRITRLEPAVRQSAAQPNLGEAGFEL